MTIQENVPLAPLTTLQVGGSARYFAELRREDDVREAVQFAKARDLPLFVLGGGSNLVIADSGWPGLVLQIAIGGITRKNCRSVLDAGADSLAVISDLLPSGNQGTSDREGAHQIIEEFLALLA